MRSYIRNQTIFAVLCVGIFLTALGGFVPAFAQNAGPGLRPESRLSTIDNVHARIALAHIVSVADRRRSPNAKRAVKGRGFSAVPTPAKETVERVGVALLGGAEAPPFVPQPYPGFFQQPATIGSQEAPAPSVAETNVSWQGSGGNGGAGNWGTKGDWSGGVVPNNTASLFYSVTIPSTTKASTVTLNQNATIDALTLGSTAVLQTDNATARSLTIGSAHAAGVVSNAGTINWWDGALTIDISQAGKGANVTEANSGNINLNGSNASLVLNDGGNGSTFTFTSNAAYGNTTLAGGNIRGSNGDETLENQVNIQGYGTISNLTLVNEYGSIEANGNAPLTITTNSGGFTNYGFVSTSGSGSLNVNGAWMNEGGIQLYAGQNVVNGTLTNTSGSLDVSNGAQLSVKNLADTHNTKVEVDQGGRIVVSGAFNDITAAGDLNSQSVYDLYGGTITYSGADITTIDYQTYVTLDGTGTYTPDIVNTSGGSHNALQALATLNGSLSLYYVPNLTTTGDFTNNGDLDLEGTSLTIGGVLHSVDSSGNLTGAWSLESGSRVYYDGSGGVNGTQDITTIASGDYLFLSGAGAGFFGKTNPAHNHLALAANDGNLFIEDGASVTTPGSFANNGSFGLENGSSFTTHGNFTNTRIMWTSGTGDLLNLGGGTLSNASTTFEFGLQVGSSSTDSLTLVGNLTNSDGLMIDGLLRVTGSFSNTGSVVLDGGSSLKVGGALQGAVDNSGNLTGTWDLEGGKVYYDGSSGVNGAQDITAIASGTSLTIGASAGITGGFLGETNTSHNHLALATNNGSLTLQNSATLSTPGAFSNDSALTVQKNATLNVGGDFTNNKSLTLQTSGSLSAKGNLTNDGSVVFLTGSLSVQGNVTNNAGIEGGLENNVVTVGGTFTNAAQGSIDVPTDSTLTIKGAFTNNGSITLFSAGNLSVQGNMTNNSSFSVSGAGTTFAVGGTLTNATNTTISIENYGALTAKELSRTTARLISRPATSACRGI